MQIRLAIRLFLIVAVWVCPTFAAEPLVLPLWPAKAPGESAELPEETVTGKAGSRQVTNVSRPTISVFRPAKDNNTGAAVIIAPGGGYRFLSWDHEGKTSRRG